MDLDLDDAQRALTDAFFRFLGREVTPERVRSAEPLGFDRDLWEALSAMGVPEMALPASLGGGGAGMLDLALVAELMGRFLAPVPFVETIVASRLLARASGRAPDSSRIATIALRPLEDGQLVPAGAVADVLVGLRGGSVVSANLGRDRETPPGARKPPENLGSAPLAWRDGDERPEHAWTTACTGPSALAAYEAAIDEWRVLGAAAIVGLAGGALDLGVRYAKDRRQFGVPIGSFQAVQHRLADVATSCEGALLLVREAAWAMDEGLADAPGLAAMAWAFGAQAAQEAVASSLHFHGGYGFMLEYDVQLYFRRAKAWSLSLGDPRVELLRVAEAVLAGAPAGEARG